MATLPLAQGQVQDLTPRFTVHHTDDRQAQAGNFPDVDFLKRLISENPSPLTALMHSWWQEAEQLVELALTKRERNRRMGSIFVKANDQIINLKLTDVLWVEAYGDYVNFVTEKNRYLVHSTMKGIENKLPADQFVRVHRSFIIRPDKIDLIEESVIQIGKKLVPIGESYRQELMSRLNLI